MAKNLIAIASAVLVGSVPSLADQGGGASTCSSGGRTILHTIGASPLLARAGEGGAGSGCVASIGITGVASVGGSGSDCGNGCRVLAHRIGGDDALAHPGEGGSGAGYGSGGGRLQPVGPIGGSGDHCGYGGRRAPTLVRCQALARVGEREHGTGCGSHLVFGGGEGSGIHLSAGEGGSGGGCGGRPAPSR